MVEVKVVLLIVVVVKVVVVTSGGGGIRQVDASDEIKMSKFFLYPNHQSSFIYLSIHLSIYLYNICVD